MYILAASVSIDHVISWYVAFSYTWRYQQKEDTFAQSLSILESAELQHDYEDASSDCLVHLCRPRTREYSTSCSSRIGPTMHRA